MPLSRAHRRFIVVDEIVVTAVINFWLNYGIAWFFFRAATVVPLWGLSSIAADTLGTAFVLPLLTALIATPLVRLQVLHGKLPPLAPADVRPSRWLRLPFAARGALLGVVAMAVVAVPVVALFALVGPAALSTSRFYWFKASFAAAVGIGATPLLGWWALQDASRRRIIGG